MTELKPHPLSLIPPPLSPDEDEALGESLEKNGQIEKITIFEGMILNGNHKYRHLIKRGIEPKFEEFIPNGVATPEDFVIAKLEGRHLNIGQRACVAALVSKLKKKDSLQNLKFVGKKWEIPKEDRGRTSVKVSKSLGVGSNSTMKATTLLNNAKQLFDKVYRAEVSLTSAYNEFRRNEGSQRKITESSRINLEAFKGEEVKIPNCFDSREEIDSFIKAMNAHGWILEMRFQDGKLFAHWFGNGYPSVGTNWSHIQPEFEFKRAVVVAAHEKRHKIK